MSCSIVYTPTPKASEKEGGWRVPLKAVLIELFGQPPFTITMDDMPTLKGALAAAESVNLIAQLLELIDAINKHESIDCTLEC